MIGLTALFAANALVWILVLVISALPLYLAVKLVGGQAGIVKIILIGLLLSLASFGAYHFIGMYAGIAMFIATLFVYKLAFRISLVKAFIAWFMQYVFVIVAMVAIVFLLGIGL